MALSDNFPSKELLEKEGYGTESEVAEATDEELLAIDGIGPVKLDEIRAIVPHKPSNDESGTGATSDTSENLPGSKTPLEPTAQSHQVQTSGVARDQTDPTTGQPLPDGIVKNERGTLTVSSTVAQNDMISPDQVKAERKAMLRNAGEKIAALLD